MPLRYQLAVLGLFVLTMSSCSALERSELAVSEGSSAIAFPSYSPDDVDAHYLAMRPEYEQDVDVFADGTRYWLALALTLDPMRMEGLERVRVVNQTSETLDSLVFRLYANHLVGESALQVSEIAVDGDPVGGDFDIHNTVLRIPLAAPLEPGEAALVEMAFALTVPQDEVVGYARLSDIEGVVSLPSFFPMLSVYEDGQWWEDELVVYGDPVFSETALFDVWLWAPSDALVAATGVLVDSEDEGEMTRHYFVTGPMRDFALAISRDFEVISLEGDVVTLNIWSAPGNEVGDQFIQDVVSRAGTPFLEQFGDYPFAEFDVVEAPVEASGIEYPGLVFIASSVWANQDIVTEWVVVHEIAHQWWYSLVGNDQVGEPWIDEGLAQYSVGVYFLAMQGETGAEMVRGYYASEVETYLSDAGTALMPIGMPVGAYENNDAYRVFVYDRAPLLWSSLVEEYGRDAVSEMLRVCFEQHRYGVVYNEDVEALVAEELGSDAQALFREWVYGEGD